MKSDHTSPILIFVNFPLPWRFQGKFLVVKLKHVHYIQREKKSYTISYEEINCFFPSLMMVSSISVPGSSQNIYIYELGGVWSLEVQNMHYLVFLGKQSHSTLMLYKEKHSGKMHLTKDKQVSFSS